MNSKFFDLRISVITLFSTLLPGVVGLWMIVELIISQSTPKNLLLWLKSYGLEGNFWLATIVFLASYFLGSLVALVGGMILDPGYDWILKKEFKYPISKENKIKRNKLLACVKTSMRSLFQWKESDLDKINLFSFSHSAIQANNPQAASEVDLCLSDSKFFRSLSILLILTGIFLLIQREIWIAVMSLLLSFVCLFRFVEQRFKSTCICYEYYIVLYAQGKFSLRQTK